VIFVLFVNLLSCISQFVCFLAADHQYDCELKENLASSTQTPFLLLDYGGYSMCIWRDGYHYSNLLQVL
jgi:hypothetical protein